MISLTLYLSLQFHINQRLDELIPQLGHEAYTVRQDASFEIFKYGKITHTRLEEEIKHNSDFEIRSRCKQLINSYYHVTNDKGYVPNISRIKYTRQRFTSQEMYNLYKVLGNGAVKGNGDEDDKKWAYASNIEFCMDKDVHHLDVPYNDKKRYSTINMTIKLLEANFSREYVISILNRMTD